MSALAESLAGATTLAEGVRNRILILDVERVDGITQQHWWEPGDLHRKKRHIRADTVIREPRTTIFGWKWYDEPDAHTVCVASLRLRNTGQMKDAAGGVMRHRLQHWKRLARLAWETLGPWQETPTMADTRAEPIPLADLTTDDWHALLTAILPEWRNHRRCGTKAACWRQEQDRFDYLLDQWLTANANSPSL